MQKYSDVVLGQRGNFMLPVQNAQVTVLTSPGSVAATIYSDNGVTVTSNPVVTDATGRFSFYAANGRYTLLIVYQTTTLTLTDIVLEDDPVNANAAVVVGGTVDATPIGGTTPSTGVFSSLTLAGVTNHGVVLANAPFTTAAPNTAGFALIDNGPGNDPSMKGYQSALSGSQVRPWTAKGQDDLNVLDFTGVIGNGSNDDTTGLQNAMTAAATGGRLLRAHGLTLKITATVTIPPTLRADFSGSVINASAISSGNALVMDGSDAISAGAYPGQFRGLTLLMPLTSGHANPALNVDGLSIQGGAGQASDYGWYDLQIYGFRDNLRFDGPNCYLHHFYRPKIGNAWRRGIAVYASSNSNENYGFFGGSIFNVNNTSFNGTGFYIDPAASTCDVSFIGTSFDYCDVSMNVTNCHINGDGVHFENNNNNPHIAVTFTSGGEKPVIVLKGGQMAGGPGVTSWTGIPVENAAGRPYLITTTQGGANIEIDFVKCGQFITTAPYQTEIIHSTDGIANRKLTVRPALDAVATAGGALPLNLTFLVNNLYVAGAGSSTGWNTSLLGSGNTVAADTVNFVAPDTGSRKITCANGNSGGIYQIIPCKGGDTLCLKSFVQCTGLSGGGGTHRLQFYAPDGTTIFSDIILARQQTANGSFAEVSWYGQVPNGATQVRIWDWVLSGTTIGATVEWSREFAWFYS